MNAVSYSWERFQDLGFAKRPRQDCASANAEKGTSKVNKVHWFVVAVVFVVVYYGTPVSASRVDAFACDSRPNAFAILLARWKYVAVRLHRSLSIRSRIFVAVAVYYLETVKLRENVTVMNPRRVKIEKRKHCNRKIFYPYFSYFTQLLYLSFVILQLLCQHLMLMI